MMIIVRKCYQKSVDMGRKLEENMYGWVGFFISGPHTPVTFLVKYPPPPPGKQGPAYAANSAEICEVFTANSAS